MITRRRALAWSAGAALGALAGCSDPSDEPNPDASSLNGPAPDEPSPDQPSPDQPSPDKPSPTGTPGGASGETAPSSEPSPSATSQGRPRPRVADTIADDLDVPWGVVFLPSGDALVSERNRGRVLRISPQGRVRSVGEVRGVDAPSGTGEGGLLGLAVDPDDAARIYAYVTTESDNRIVVMRLRGNRLTGQRNVLTGIPRNVHHNGGRLLFGPDGLLYVSTGDAERGESAQDRDSLAGKILRLRKDGRAAPDNPFDNRVYSYGHRNVEGLAFDADGRLWATEFGAQKTDELNQIRAGRNYGWPRVEGRSERFTAPAATWSPTSTCSPAGVAIARGTAFVAALRGQCLFAVPLDGRKAGRPRPHFAEEYGRLRSVTVAPDGSLWVTTSNTDGRRSPRRNDDRILRVTL